MTSRSRLIPILLIVAVLLAACGSGGKSTSGTSVSGPDTIVIKNFAFSPQSITVAPGATVTVHNEDVATHTVTATGGAFNTGDISPGQTRTFTAPAKAGSYGYICNIHQFMTGTLSVS